MMYSEKKETTQPRRKLRWVLVAFSICAIFVYCKNLPKPRKVPHELVGTWRSTDPRYADRSFEIDAYTINFGTGKGTVTTGFIQKVEVVTEGSRTLYTISYVDDGQEEQCSFYYTPANEKTIYFKNQLSIPWVKDS